MRKYVRLCLFAGSLILPAFSFPGAAFATTEDLTQLISNARVLALDAASSTRQRFSDGQITEFLNEGQRQAISQTGCLQDSFNITLSSGTTYYATPSDFVSVVRVWRYTSGAVLEQSPASLDGRSRGWNMVSGTPSYYYVDFSTPTKIGFAPFPGAVTDTDTYVVSYNQQATDLASGSDLPFNGVATLTEYYSALPYYAAAIMSAVDNQPMSQAYMQLFQGRVTQMKLRCLERPAYRPSASGVP